MNLDLLRVVNVGDKPLILRHDGKGDVTIDPGRNRILLAEYAYISFGDPRAINAGKDKAREVEFKNARTLWGYYPGVYPEAAWEGTGVTVEGNEVGPFKPQYECYDMDDQRVFMVLDDPDGSLTAAATGMPTLEQSDAIEQAALHAQIAAQQRQIDELRNLILMREENVPGVGPAPQFEVPDVNLGEEDDDEDDDDEEEEEPEEEEPKPTAKAKAKTVRPVKKAAKRAAPKAQPKPGAEIPKAPDNEPPVTADNPGTTRVGGR